MGDPGWIPGPGRSLREGNGDPLQYGQRSLADYSLWGHRELGTSELLTQPHAGQKNILCCVTFKSKRDSENDLIWGNRTQ